MFPKPSFEFLVSWRAGNEIEGSCQKANEKESKDYTVHYV